MGVSGYTRIAYSASELDIYCTDNEIIDWVCNEVVKLFPNSKLKSQKKLITGENYHCRLVKLPGDKDQDIAYWVLKQFCLKGWEPFEVNHIFSFHTDSVIHLRLSQSK